MSNVRKSIIYSLKKEKKNELTNRVISCSTTRQLRDCARAWN